MTTKPRLLDLFCGAGGAAMGYYRAGFEVVGVDIAPQPRYPFTFIQADALSYFEDEWMFFDAYHASPPCQDYSILRYAPNRDMSSFPRLIDAVRESFEFASASEYAPWVIENVATAPLRTGLMLCGSMFGLKVYRHRHFESNILLWNKVHQKHQELVNPPGSRMATYKKDGMMTVAGHLFNTTAARVAMGIDWMNHDELAESIPPSYTEYIGRQLIRLFD